MAATPDLRCCNSEIRKTVAVSFIDRMSRHDISGSLPGAATKENAFRWVPKWQKKKNSHSKDQIVVPHTSTPCLTWTSDWRLQNLFRIKLHCCQQICIKTASWIISFIDLGFAAIVLKSHPFPCVADRITKTYHWQELSYNASTTEMLSRLPLTHLTCQSSVVQFAEQLLPFSSHVPLLRHWPFKHEIHAKKVSSSWH